MNIGALGVNYFLLKPRQCPAVDGAAGPAMKGILQDIDGHHTPVTDYCLNLDYAVIGVVDGAGGPSISILLAVRCGMYRRCCVSLLWE